MFGFARYARFGPASWCAVTLAAVAGIAGSGTVAASAAAPIVHRFAWHTAIQEPGAQTTVKHQYAGINALSCPSSGNCLAGGYFKDTASRWEAFTVTERNGAWQRPAELRGIAVVAPHGDAQITAVACGSAGNCVVGGIYPSNLGYQLPFIDREVAGKWQAAEKVPGITPDFTSEVTAASCGSAGNCLIGGYYNDTAGQHAFLVPEKHGVWQPERGVPGVSGLSTIAFSETTALTCRPAGTCVVGGYYATSPGQGAADQLSDFVVSETSGVWARPVTLTGTVPGTITSLSCSSRGNCAAALGIGDVPEGTDGPAVAVERNGSWGPAAPVPGITLGGKFESGATSVSCPANGDCVIGGSYSPGGSVQAFVADQAGGSWHAAIKFPGIAKLNRGRTAQITAIACTSAGNCVAAGGYLDESNDSRPFLIQQAGGRWGTPITVPGLPVASTPYPASAAITALGCPAIGRCDAAGWFMRSGEQIEGFVVSQGNRAEPASPRPSGRCQVALCPEVRHEWCAGADPDSGGLRGAGLLRQSGNLGDAFRRGT